MTSKDVDANGESATSEFELKAEESFSGKKSSCSMKDANRIVAAAAVATDAAYVTSGQPVIDVSVIPTSAAATATATAQNQQVATSAAADHGAQTPPPVAPPRYHRTSSHNSMSKGTGSRILDQDSRPGNKGMSQHEDRALQEAMLNSGSSNTGKQSVKQMLRQRHPALLLQPVRSDPHTTSIKSMPSPPQTATTTMHAYSSGSHIMPNLKTPGSSLMPSTFWTGNRYPSESEFDTTRLEAYISSFATRSALLSSSHQHQQQPQYLQQQPQQHVQRGLRRSSKSHNNRSKSVDRSVKLMNGNISQALNHQRQVHMLLPTVARYHNHPYHDQQHHSNQDHKHSLSKIISSLRNVSLHSSGHSNSNRALIVSRSESLNSSDPESGSTSGDNETDTPLNSIKSPSIHFMDPPKSALKKSSSNSFPVSSSSSSSKNVTFSAFATVQMVDR